MFSRRKDLSVFFFSFLSLLLLFAPNPNLTYSFSFATSNQILIIHESKYEIIPHGGIRFNSLNCVINKCIRGPDSIGHLHEQYLCNYGLRTRGSIVGTHKFFKVERMTLSNCLDLLFIMELANLSRRITLCQGWFGFGNVKSDCHAFPYVPRHFPSFWKPKIHKVARGQVYIHGLLQITMGMRSQHLKISSMHLSSHLSSKHEHFSKANFKKLDFALSTLDCIFSETNLYKLEFALSTPDCIFSKGNVYLHCKHLIA